ncbi:MAG: hypothetical protein K5840_06155 [Eubacterium sp.]|nr:hypothetical protein [Eubacterium sp.]
MPKDIQKENDYTYYKVLELSSPPDRTLATLKGTVFLYAREDRALLRIALYEGCLKHFYPDPENYFYFPAEDCAYHKDVAQFAAKSHRKKATASTAYTKKEGLYLPVPDDYGTTEDTPLFYEDRYKKQAYTLTDGSMEEIQACFDIWISTLSQRGVLSL